MADGLALRAMDTKIGVQVHQATVPRQPLAWKAITSHIVRDLGHWQDNARTEVENPGNGDQDDLNYTRPRCAFVDI